MLENTNLFAMIKLLSNQGFDDVGCRAAADGGLPVATLKA
jgi:hypothetical protein